MIMVKTTCNKRRNEIQGKYGMTLQFCAVVDCTLWVVINTTSRICMQAGKWKYRESLKIE